MSRELKYKTKCNIWISMLAAVFILLQIATITMDAKHINTFNGVFLAFQYGACLLMLYINSKKGIRVSIILISLSILVMLRAMFFGHTLAPLPGICNMVFYMVTIIIMAKYYQNKSKENRTDYLTGVLNRKGLYKNLEEKIDNNSQFGVIYINLDNFKYINDNYGHAYGDELLRKLTKRLSRKVGDNGKIGRTSGADLIAIVDKSTGCNIEEFANDLLETIREKMVLIVDGIKIDCYVTCYAGVASFPEDGKDPETLIKYADIAMCEAAFQKLKTANVFNKLMVDSLNRQIEIEKLIKEGLEKDYFYLVYQPQFKLGNKVLRGFETLIRMKTPDGTVISPAEFIPIAEKGNLILQIDDYVIKRAMREFKPIVEQNNELTVSVNVSAKNICSFDFVDKIKSIIDLTDFPAHNLEIEITEYCMVDSMDTTIDNIKKLRALGIQVALDDFGTGYTSLNYVAKMPINLLKVDKSLIDDIGNDVKNREFVQAVISMGHMMGCEVISEGVEDEEQLKYLNENGCDFVQGFVWGKPLEYEVAKALSTNVNA